MLALKKISQIMWSDCYLVFFETFVLVGFGYICLSILVSKRPRSKYTTYASYELNPRDTLTDISKI